MSRMVFGHGNSFEGVKRTKEDVPNAACVGIGHDPKFDKSF